MGSVDWKLWCELFVFSMRLRWRTVVNPVWWWWWQSPGLAWNRILCSARSAGCTTTLPPDYATLTLLFFSLCQQTDASWDTSKTSWRGKNKIKSLNKTYRWKWTKGPRPSLHRYGISVCWCVDHSESSLIQLGPNRSLSACRKYWLSSAAPWKQKHTAKTQLKKEGSNREFQAQWALCSKGFDTNRRGFTFQQTYSILSLIQSGRFFFFKKKKIV